MTAARTRKPISSPTPSAIDALYGLEPVFEPGTESAQPGSTPGTSFVPVSCPYCGESFETLLDFSAGSTDYIEDCQICCQPIELHIVVDTAGALDGFTARRTD